MIKNNILIKFILIIFITSCGFKPMNQIVNFKIEEIELNGDRRINFFLKNKLINMENKNGEKLYLQIKTNKTKSIKEKNIKNEITKYEVIITSVVHLKIIEKRYDKIFTISSKGELKVANQYSGTLDNEKNLVNSLTNDLLKKITQNIAKEINAY